MGLKQAQDFASHDAVTALLRAQTLPTEAAKSDGANNEGAAASHLAHAVEVQCTAGWGPHC
jgi:hypothetical protein